MVCHQSFHRLVRFTPHGIAAATDASGMNELAGHLIYIRRRRIREYGIVALPSPQVTIVR